MNVHAAISAVPCSGCGLYILGLDFDGSGLAVVKCPNCKREWEIRVDPMIGKIEVNPKKIN